MTFTDPFRAAPSTKRLAKRRVRVVVALAAVVVLAAAAVVAVVMWPSGESPREVATRYFEALAAGDAETALSLGSAEPASTQLITREVLAQQLQQMPITNIRVGDEQKTPATTADRVYVDAAATFGDRDSHGLVQMNRVDGDWKLASAFVTANDAGHTVSLGESGRAADTLGIFGIPVGDTGSFSMFPGALALSTSNPFLDVEQAAPFLLDKTLQFGSQPRSFAPVFYLNETGEKAIHAAVTKWMTACYTPGFPPAGPCDKIDPTQGGQYLPGAHLTGPVDLGQCTYQFNGFLQAVAACNFGTTPFEAQRLDGTVEPRIWTGFTTPVDITDDPPAVVAP